MQLKDLCYKVFDLQIVHIINYMLELYCYIVNYKVKLYKTQRLSFIVRVDYKH